jgi:hypothetical protein
MISKLKLVLFDYHQKYKAFPSISYISKELRQNEKVVIRLLDEMTRLNQIRKVGGNYYFIHSETVPQVVVKREIEEKKEPINKQSKLIIQIAMAAISIVSIGVSAYYTAEWFHNFLPYISSWICALTIVFYGSFAPQAAMILKKGFVKIPLWITAIIVICFSITSTLAGQYRQDTEKNQKVVSETKQEKLTLLKSEEKSISDSLNSTKEEVDLNTKQLGQFSKKEMKSDDYKNLFWKSYTLRELRKKYEQQLTDKRKEISEYMAKEGVTEVKQRNDFYSWVAEVLPFNPSTIEFWLYLFAAMFFDIMAPLGLHIALKREDK